MTYEQKIKSMSTEELAVLLLERDGNICEQVSGCIDDCKQCTINWLKSEIEPAAGSEAAQ